jgi:hypothetical protein
MIVKLVLEYRIVYKYVTFKVSFAYVETVFGILRNNKLKVFPLFSMSSQ